MWWLKKKKKESNPFSLRDKHQRYYQSRTHKRWRELVLANYPLCVRCEREGRLEPATIADHVESLTIAWHKRADVGNGVGLCFICHNKKSNQERYDYHLYEQRKLVDNKMALLGEF